MYQIFILFILVSFTTQAADSRKTPKKKPKMNLEIKVTPAGTFLSKEEAQEEDSFIPDGLEEERARQIKEKEFNKALREEAINKSRRKIEEKREDDKVEELVPGRGTDSI